VAEFVLDFLRAMCERDIFGVDPEQEQKGILISVVQPARDDFFYTKTHTHPRVCCKTTHTLKHARREKEREREREREREATMMLMTAPTTTTTSAPSDDVPPLFLRCF
jgi:hypothetical protein